MLKKNYDFKIPVFVLEQGKLKVILEHAPIWWGSDDKIIYDNLIFMIPPVTFKEVFEEIGDDSFALCNQCYLVNLKYVEEMQDEKIMKIFICDSTQSVFNSIIKKFEVVQDLEVLDVSHMSRKVIKHGTTDVPIEYYYTEISMKNVDKWYAIEYLIDKLNIEKNEVMTIGDNMNDKKMIEEAGLGVVMKGSTPVVTAVADFVTDDNNNEGVAKAIGKFILT